MALQALTGNLETSKRSTARFRRPKKQLWHRHQDRCKSSLSYPSPRVKGRDYLSPILPWDSPASKPNATFSLPLLVLPGADAYQQGTSKCWSIPLLVMTATRRDGNSLTADATLLHVRAQLNNGAILPPRISSHTYVPSLMQY